MEVLFMDRDNICNRKILFDRHYFLGLYSFKKTNYIIKNFKLRDPDANLKESDPLLIKGERCFMF